MCVCGERAGDGNEAGKHRESRHFAATNQSQGQRSNGPAANNIIFRASKLQAKHKQLQLRLVLCPSVCPPHRERQVERERESVTGF